MPMDLDFALPVYGLRFDGATAILDPVKAATLFSTRPNAGVFSKLLDDIPQIVELSDRQAVRAYLLNAKGKGGTKVVFDLLSLQSYGASYLDLDEAIRQLPISHRRQCPTGRREKVSS